MELLTVILIIGLVTAILLPALTNAKRKAQETACGANLHFVGFASSMYLDEHADRFWPYYTQNPDGRLWWFGFEPDGPGQGSYRPLDKSQGVLFPYMKSADDRLQCPSFPYGHTNYNPKFSEHSASYGYNLHLVGHRRSEYLTRSASVFVFADGAHFDFGQSINEGYYLIYNEGALFPSGYGHFRHRGRAQVLFMDGHVEGQPLRGPQYHVMIAGAAGNLSDEAGTNAIYGL